jgi:hypothetical protein
LATLLFLPLRRVDPATLRQVWDSLNIVGYIVLAWFLVLRSLTERRIAVSTGVILALMVTLNPWNKEIRLGQYNVLTMAALLIAGLGIAWGPSGWLRGALACVAVLLKPTNILFLPWLWRNARSRRAVLQGAVVCVSALAVWYLFRFGARSLWNDSLAWLRFLPLSTAKHLHQEDNFGLARFLDEKGEGRWISLAWAAGWTAVFAATYGSRGWLLGFCVAGVVSVVLTPMAWFQNYTLCLPFVVYLLAGLLSRDTTVLERTGYAFALTSLYFGLEINPALCGPGIGLGFCHALVPLWSLLIAIASAGLVPAVRLALAWPRRRRATA